MYDLCFVSLDWISTFLVANWRFAYPFLKQAMLRRRLRTTCISIWVSLRLFCFVRRSIAPLAQCRMSPPPSILQLWGRNCIPTSTLCGLDLRFMNRKMKRTLSLWSTPVSIPFITDLMCIFRWYLGKFPCRRFNKFPKSFAGIPLFGTITTPTTMIKGGSLIAWRLLNRSHLYVVILYICRANFRVDGSTSCKLTERSDDFHFLLFCPQSRVLGSVGRTSSRVEADASRFLRQSQLRVLRQLGRLPFIGLLV